MIIFKDVTFQCIERSQLVDKVNKNTFIDISRKLLSRVADKIIEYDA